MSVLPSPLSLSSLRETKQDCLNSPMAEFGPVLRRTKGYRHSPGFKSIAQFLWGRIVGPRAWASDARIWMQGNQRRLSSLKTFIDIINLLGETQRVGKIPASNYSHRSLTPQIDI